MSSFETASVLEAYQQRCEDRIAVLEEGDRTIIAVADGAGGIGGGDQAAEAVVREIKSAAKDTSTENAWVELLRQTDLRIGQGESTAVVVDLQPSGMCGASVGDSQAWLIDQGEVISLTANQRRKPLLGSGDAIPIGFTHNSLTGVLVVATDGFCSYAKRAEVVKIVMQNEFVVLPRKLLASVRLRSGALWDDVGIVVCRKRPQTKRARQRYALDLPDLS